MIVVNGNEGRSYHARAHDTVAAIQVFTQLFLAWLRYIWIGAFKEEEANRFLRIPSDIIPVAMFRSATALNRLFELGTVVQVIPDEIQPEY